jgi:nucleoside-diphosphate-sugar epimerase
MKSVLIVGCGDIGERIAQRCDTKSIEVTGLVHSEKSALRLQAANINALAFDLNNIQQGDTLALSAETIIYLLPPPSEGETDPLIRQFLAALALRDVNTRPQKFILLSTSAVYGDCQGQWIDEAQPVNPQTARGLRRWDAEQAVRAWSTEHAIAAVVLRVAGIYGAGRLPLARLKKGLPILRESVSPYSNRIHQDDLAQICMAALEKGKGGEIYNVSDGQPSTMSRYFKDIARAHGLPLPAEISLQEAREVMSAGMLSYLHESRRMENNKLLTELDIVLQYPDLAAGLLAS